MRHEECIFICTVEEQPLHKVQLRADILGNVTAWEGIATLIRGVIIKKQQQNK